MRVMICLSGGDKRTAEVPPIADENRAVGSVRRVAGFGHSAEPKQRLG